MSLESSYELMVQGDKKAEAEFYLQLEKYVAGTLAKWATPDQFFNLDELIAQVVSGIFIAMPGYDPRKSRLTTWIFNQCRYIRLNTYHSKEANLTCDWTSQTRKRRLRRASSEIKVGGSIIDRMSTIEDPNRVCDSEQGGFDQLISHLPERRQRMFRMRFVDGMRLDDIADEMGVSKQAIQQNIAKGLEILRDLDDGIWQKPDKKTEGIEVSNQEVCRQQRNESPRQAGTLMDQRIDDAIKLLESGDDPKVIAELDKRISDLESKLNGLRRVRRLLSSGHTHASSGANSSSRREGTIGGKVAELLEKNGKPLSMEQLQDLTETTSMQMKTAVGRANYLRMEAGMVSLVEPATATANDD